MGAAQSPGDAQVPSPQHTCPVPHVERPTQLPLRQTSSEHVAGRLRPHA